MVDPIASVCSTHPPVSVCGTVDTCSPLEAFLGSMESISCGCFPKDAASSSLLGVDGAPFVAYAS
jgi:hypothetical protein